MVVLSKIKEGQEMQPKEYITYFEDLCAVGGLHFEPDTEIRQKRPFINSLLGGPDPNPGVSKTDDVGPTITLP